MIVGLGIICLGAKLAAQSSQYIVIDLGQIDGTSSTAAAINDAGVVAGYIETALRDTRAARAVDGRTFQYVPGLETATSSASDVNEFGDLAGIALVSTSTWTLHAIRYTDAGGVEDLGSFGGNSFGVGINRSGQVAGWSFAGSVFSTRSDDIDPAPVCRISNVVSSEPTDPAAIDINGALTVGLRAERDASGDGRVYRIEISCSDASGNTSATSVNVLVPHDVSQVQ